MRSYWISWFHTRGLGDFELRTPWWISGTRLSDGAHTICAAVRAVDEGAARQVVVNSYDKSPDEIEWRFVEGMPEGWSPFTDRFRRGEFMTWPPEAPA